MASRGACFSILTSLVFCIQLLSAADLTENEMKRIEYLKNKNAEYTPSREALLKKTLANFRNVKPTKVVQIYVTIDMPYLNMVMSHIRAFAKKNIHTNIRISVLDLTNASTLTNEQRSILLGSQPATDLHNDRGGCCKGEPQFAYQFIGSEVPKHVKSVPAFVLKHFPFPAEVVYGTSVNLDKFIKDKTKSTNPAEN